MKEIMIVKLCSIVGCLIMLSGCMFFGGGDREDLKSPCVGIENSPCADQKRDVNAWWLT